jgi:hypothetical protein
MDCQLADICSPGRQRRLWKKFTCSNMIARDAFSVAIRPSSRTTHAGRDPMPVYTFKLHDGYGGVEDEAGVSFSEQGRAVRYAENVVHELMKGRELETRCWRLDVFEAGNAEPICQIPFARVDSSLDHLTPGARDLIEAIAERKRVLGEVIHSVKATIQESRALVARARGKPYLASRFGKPVIRDI